VTTILLNAVFNSPLEIVHRSGQRLLIDREHFLPDGILQLAQITGFVSVHTALQVLPEEEITWWQTCSVGASFRVSVMCHGPQGLLTYHVISFSGGTWRAVCTLTNPVIWASWRMPSGKKCSRSIKSRWPERWTISSGVLKTAFKRMVVT